MRKLTNSIVILILTISFLFTGCNQQIPDDNISEVLPADSLVTSAKESSSKTSSKTSKNSSKGGSSVKNSSKTQPWDTLHKEGVPPIFENSGFMLFSFVVVFLPYVVGSLLPNLPV